MVSPPPGSGRTTEMCGSMKEWWARPILYVALTTASACRSAVSTSPRLRVTTPVVFRGLSAGSSSAAVEAPWTEASSSFAASASSSTAGEASPIAATGSTTGAVSS